MHNLDNKWEVSMSKCGSHRDKRTTGLFLILCVGSMAAHVGVRIRTLRVNRARRVKFHSLPSNVSQNESKRIFLNDVEEEEDEEPRQRKHAYFSCSNSYFYHNLSSFL